MATQPQAQIKPRVTPPPHAPPTPEEMLAQAQDIIVAQATVIRAQIALLQSYQELLAVQETLPPPGP